MSAEVACWKISLACTRAEADAFAADADPFPGADEPPVLNVLEPDPAEPDRWRLEAYFDHDPADDEVALVRALVADAACWAKEVVADADWVTLSQAGLEPIRAGRFVVHTAAHPIAAPPGTIALRIEASRAFGTGHHATTAGCLDALDRLERQGARFDNVADVGTGTGLLAFAAIALWPGARALASDIDPVAIEIVRENAEANAVPLDRLALVVADGLDHPSYRERAPFDLIVANILAQPLIDLAPAIAAATARGGTVLLAGLLDHQAVDVIAAYAAAGFTLAEPVAREEWPALQMRRG